MMGTSVIVNEGMMNEENLEGSVSDVVDVLEKDYIAIADTNNINVDSYNYCFMLILMPQQIINLINLITFI